MAEKEKKIVVEYGQQQGGVTPTVTGSSQEELKSNLVMVRHPIKKEDRDKKVKRKKGGTTECDRSLVYIFSSFIAHVWLVFLVRDLSLSWLLTLSNIY